ncbi:MAG: DNA-3-methyladenine glycosylase [Actinobacteria bacterium]|nr:DNA-3-methyladenine glycosylase [Actinomycetota bacterium]
MLQESFTLKAHKPLPVDFYERETAIVARDLLGKLVVRKTANDIMTARIVEVEAYLGENDPASHAYQGITPRCAIMFGRAGRAYVYLNYGVHCLLNVVAEREGCAGAILIRGLEPVSGIDTMMMNRPVEKVVDLTNGPGKLTKALQIDLRDNGLDITVEGSGLFIVNGAEEAFSIIESPRIGISAGTDMLLRFSIEGNPYVSR